VSHINITATSLQLACELRRVRLITASIGGSVSFTGPLSLPLLRLGIDVDSPVCLSLGGGFSLLSFFPRTTEGIETSTIFPLVRGCLRATMTEIDSSIGNVPPLSAKVMPSSCLTLSALVVTSWASTSFCLPFPLSRACPSRSQIAVVVFALILGFGATGGRTLDVEAEGPVRNCLRSV
jgi:hypothetical protein